MSDTPFTRGDPTAILVVETNAIVRCMLRRALERRHHHVVVATDAMSALALFQHAEEPIGVVISEQHLAGMSGSDLADELRRRDPTLPILLVGSDFEDASHEYPELRKPFTLAALERRIEELLGVQTAAAAPRSEPREASADERT